MALPINPTPLEIQAAIKALENAGNQNLPVLTMEELDNYTEPGLVLLDYDAVGKVMVQVGRNTEGTPYTFQTIFSGNGANLIRRVRTDSDTSYRDWEELFIPTNMYTTTGTNSDGPMSQAAVTTALTAVRNDLDNKIHIIKDEDDSLILQFITPDGSVTTPNLRGGGGGSTNFFSGTAYADFSEGEAAMGIKAFDWTARMALKLTFNNPPSQAVTRVAASADGSIVMIVRGSSGSYSAQIYKRGTDNEYYSVSGGSTATNTSQSPVVAVSPDGAYAVFISNIPAMRFYGISGDSATSIDGLGDGLPNVSFNGADLSPNNAYLALATNTTPFVLCYKFDGSTLTALPTPATLPPNTANGLAWSPDGTLLAVAHAGTPFGTVYSLANDVLTKLPNPATLPNTTSNAVAWSPDGKYLAYALNASPYIAWYKRNADNTFTKLPNPAALPINSAKSIAFSPDSSVLAIGHTSTPFVTYYGVNSNDTLDKLSGKLVAPTGNVNSLAFGGKSLFIGHATTPFFTAMDILPQNTIVPPIGLTDTTMLTYSDYILGAGYTNAAYTIGAAATVTKAF